MYDDLLVPLARKTEEESTNTGFGDSHGYGVEELTGEDVLCCNLKRAVWYGIDMSTKAIVDNFEQKTAQDSEKDLDMLGKYNKTCRFPACIVQNLPMLQR